MAFPIRKHGSKTERIGRMRHRVQFVTQTTYVDNIGGEVHTWATGDAVWGHVELRAPGSEDDVLGDRITNVTNGIVTVRYNSAIEPKNRMLFDGSEWEILSILPDTHKTYMQMEVVKYEGDYTSNDIGTVPFSPGYYSEEFPAHASSTITVTVNGGQLPTDQDQIEVYYDTGQIISPNYWTHAGSTITLTFTPPGEQSIWVKFSYNI
jgi:head-tail adaptor